MKVLVTGAGGQLGRALLTGHPAGASVVALDHAALDITDAAAVAAQVRAVRPDWIFNAAAFTAVDAAERQAEAAHALNAQAVGHLARTAADVGARLIQVSTDFVFDGRSAIPYAPASPVAPLSQYGATKREGELQAEGAACGAIIVRTSWVYAAQGKNFVRTMIDLMRSHPALRVVYDQIGAPTWVRDLAGALWLFAERAVPAGIYHWQDAGVASWYDFAVAIQEEALARGLITAPIPIEPIRTADYPTPARRPAYSVLDVATSVAAIGRRPEHWRANLRKMLDELAAT